MSSKVKQEPKKESDSKDKDEGYPFSLSTTSVNKYDPHSLKAMIDEEIVEVSVIIFN